MKKLKDVLPEEFFTEFMDSSAATFLDVEVLQEFDGTKVSWVGSHKYVFLWWSLKNGKAVGWNENPAKGWSFPVSNIKQS